MNVLKHVMVSEQGEITQAQLAELFVNYQYKNGFFGFVSNKLIRKHIIDESKSCFEIDLKLAEDLDFYAKIYPYVRKAYISQINSFYYMQTDTNYLNNNNIDYYSQITVHLDIKHWFLTNKLYTKYKSVLDKKIADYVYFSLFYANENKDDLKFIFDKIINNEEVMDSIDLNLFSGFQKLLLSSVKRKNYLFLTTLLRGRQFVRHIYRRIKNE